MILQNTEQRSLWYKKIFYYLKSGQSLVESVKTAATDIDSVYIYEELSAGLRFSEVCSLPEFTKVFTSIEIALLQVAEQTGNIQNVCNTLSIMLKNQHEQHQKLIAAMIYPILVLCMATGLLFMILFAIVPKISSLFISMEHMPFMTTVLIGLSDHVVSFWYIDFLVICFIYTALLYTYKKTTYKHMIDICFRKLCIRTPFIQNLYILWFVERWLQIVYMSLTTKVSLVQSLIFAQDSVSDAYIKKQFEKVKEAVVQGNSCSESIKRMDVIVQKRLSDWISVIASGEKTGRLEDVFGVSYEYVSIQMKNSIDRFQKIVEPVLIVLVGVMVLCICVAIIVPMYQLTQSVQ